MLSFKLLYFRVHSWDSMEDQAWMFCTECGASYRPGVLFCSSCGEQVMVPGYQNAPLSLLPPVPRYTQYRPSYIPPPGKKKGIIIASTAIIAVMIIVILIASASMAGNASVSKNNKNDDYATLQSQYSSLQNQYRANQINCSSLQISINNLQNQSNYINLVKMGSLAHDYYETIRSDKSPWLPTHQEKVNFYSSLSKHDQGRNYWSDLDSEYYSYSNTHRYLEAKNILTAILHLSGADQANNAADRMAAILNFLNTNIQYQYDLKDRPFAPTETLSSGSGDCEDFSILASALFEMEGISSAIATFTNSAGEGHAMVLVQDPTINAKAYYSYSDLTNYGLSSGKWIEIEPQSLLTDQLTGMDKWNINAAAET
jgi:predicted transglutaminase-like cysteine proteinase